MKRLCVLTQCALRLISHRVRMESYFRVARDSATIVWSGSNDKGRCCSWTMTLASSLHCAIAACLLSRPSKSCYYGILLLYKFNLFSRACFQLPSEIFTLVFPSSSFYRPATLGTLRSLLLWLFVAL
jgi:hypothetical protein